MTTIINASTSSGLVFTADQSGALQFQTNGTTPALTLSTSQNATLANNASVVGSVTSVNTFGFKNRIINGAMVIDQRNAGASTTPTTTGVNVYNLDRWYASLSVASKYSVQQNAGSVTPPIGFTNYLGITSLAATTVGTSDYYTISQTIEGYNVADMGFGTANAKTFTLSFWVYSSLTGTFGGSIQNAGTRSYPFTYTISSASTWTQISITVAGDTTGTWNTTNGTGLNINWGLGVGSTYTAAAGAWGAGNKVSANSSVNVVSTSGATFYITGVQLEVGSQATSFDFRSYGTELALCQRYFTKSFNQNLAPAQNTGVYAGAIQYIIILAGANYNAAPVTLPVTMRTAPTVTFYSPSAASSNWYNPSLGAASGTSQVLIGATGQNNFQIVNNPQVAGDGVSQTVSIHYAATAEL
jgi:hypothetical protein